RYHGPGAPRGDRMSLEITINQKATTVDAEGEMPLLWALRDVLDLKGTKYGCGIGMCGACPVLMDVKPIRSCLTPLSRVNGKITTIEGLATGDKLHVLQETWV